jgi:hypothetical protein
LVFLSVSFLVGWVLTASFIRKEPFLELASDAAFVFCYVMAYGAALYLAWRMVKGRAAASRFFAINFYYAGVLKLIESGWFMAMVGVLRALDPDFYERFMNSAHSGNSGAFRMGQIEKLKAGHVSCPSCSSRTLDWLR